MVENLRYYLSAYNSSEPVHFGHKFRQFVQSGYMQGGAGYILSKEALRRFAEIGYSNATLCRTDPGGYEDVEMGYCMERLGCRGIDTRDSFGRNRFLPLQLERHLQLGLPSDQFWFWDYIFYPVKDASVFNVTTNQMADLFSDLDTGFRLLF